MTTKTKKSKAAPEIDRTRETVLILRTCKADRTSHNGFQYPESGYVAAPDWEANEKCGNGLHGWLKGEGSADLAYSEKGRLGQVIETYADHIIDLNGKCKYPFGWVLFTGDLMEAARIVSQRYPKTQVLFGTATADNRGTATAGYQGTATAGDYGTATAGNYGTATAGNYGTATAGNRGTATAGYRGTATAGDRGTATAGDFGTATAGNYGAATAGYRGTATAGYQGTATAGYQGTATAGDQGTATAGDRGTATAGEDGVLIIQRWNGKRYRYQVANVGEDGILPNTPYQLDEDGKFVKATA